MPWLAGKETHAGEQGINQDAQRHRPDSADPVTEPAERQSTAGGAEQEQGCDPAHPDADELVGCMSMGQRAAGGIEHALQRRPRHQRKNPHLQPIKHPTQESRRQHQPSSGTARGRWQDRSRAFRCNH
jgi:hypothetical protein